MPAVVKDGFLAPYQDLAYFVRPQADEISFIANADSQLLGLVRELCEERVSASAPQPPDEDLPPTMEDETAEANQPEAIPLRESLPAWLTRVLKERRLPTGVVKDWNAFERRDPDFSHAARCFLIAHDLPLPTRCRR